MIERRRFLAGFSATVVVAGLAPSHLLRPVPHPVDGDALGRDLFTRLIGSHFRVHRAEGAVLDTFRLVAVEDGPCCSALEQFAAVWEGANSDVLPEGIYKLSSGNQAPLVLALTREAVQPKPTYRATFSLLRSPA